MAQSPDESQNIEVDESNPVEHEMEIDSTTPTADEAKIEPDVLTFTLSDDDDADEDYTVEMEDGDYDEPAVDSGDDSDDEGDNFRLIPVRGDIELNREEDRWERVPIDRRTYIRIQGLANGTLDDEQREHIVNGLLGRGVEPEPEVDDSFFVDEALEEKDADRKFEYSVQVTPNEMPRSIPALLAGFEAGKYTLENRRARFDISEKLFPKEAKQKFRTTSRVYCCEYSKDGSTVSFAEQNRSVHLIDTETWKEVRHVELVDFGWSIVDTSFSPDKRFVAFSGWSEYVTLVNVDESYGNRLTEKFNLEPPPGHFCHFGIQFDPSSRLLLSCGSRGTLMVYDFERQEKTLQDDNAHLDDVNSGTFVDSPHVLASGSDDATIKLWDLRLAVKCIGGFVGHHQGITSLASRGDERYILSNSKDQSMKLWDLRRMNTATEVQHGQRTLLPHTRRFDYRNDIYRDRGRRIGMDNSLVTYMGHAVRYTLIRASFSPMFTTGSKYVFTGSADGAVYIYDALTGELKQKLDHQHQSAIRDVAWHPYEPVICSAGFDEVVMRWGHESSVGDDPFVTTEIEETALATGRRQRMWPW